MAKKKLSERKEAWFRIIVLVVSGVIFSIWKLLVQILAIVNWFITVFSSKRNKELAVFCKFWNTEVYKFVRYIAFASNQRPFPFSNMETKSKFEK